MRILKEIPMGTSKQRYIHQNVRFWLLYTRSYRKGCWTQGMDFQINMKGHSNIFLAVGLCFLLMISGIFCLPNNMNQENAPGPILRDPPGSGRDRARRN